MEEDKRAEAMKQAREAAAEADAKKKKAKKPKGEGGLSIGGKEIDIGGITGGLKDAVSNVKIPGVTGDGGKGTGNVQDLGETAQRTAKKVWGSRNGRLVVIGIAALLLLVIGGNIIGGMMGRTQNVPLNFEITDSCLSIYKNDAYTSGYAWDAYVEIKNTGSENIYLSNMAFKVETDSGESIMLDKALSVFPSILQPGELGYIYNQFGSELVYEASADKAIAESYPQIANGTVGLNLRVAADCNAAAGVPGTYSVVENSVQMDKGLHGGDAMQCQVVNETGSLGSNMTAVFVMYTDSEDGDDNLKCIGITSTKVGQIKPHETVMVRMDPLEYVHAYRNLTVTDWKMYVY